MLIAYRRTRTTLVTLVTLSESKNKSNQNVTLTSAGVKASVGVLDRKLVVRFCPGTKSVVELSGFSFGLRLVWFGCDREESVQLTHSVCADSSKNTTALKGQRRQETMSSTPGSAPAGSRTRDLSITRPTPHHYTLPSHPSAIYMKSAYTCSES